MNTGDLGSPPNRLATEEFALKLGKLADCKSYKKD
jgi:hypothetical protein